MVHYILLLVAFVLLQVQCFKLLTPNPLVIWHGLGDSAENEGLLEFKQSLESNFPGLFVHLVEVAQGRSEDQRATIFGNVNEQVDLVADQLRAVPELDDGFDAIG